MPERGSEGASGAAGRRGPGAEPFPRLGDWLVGIGVFYALAMVPISLFCVAAVGCPILIVDSHMGPLRLARVGWIGWPWFLAPYGFVGLLLSIAGRRRLPLLCGLLVAVWLVEGALLVLWEIALGV